MGLLGLLGRHEREDGTAPAARPTHGRDGARPPPPTTSAASQPKRKYGPHTNVPPLSSPLVRQYLLALSAALLAAMGLVCAFVAGWSCAFASVSYSHDGKGFDGYAGDGYDDLPSSVGVFCRDDDAATESLSGAGSDGRRTAARAFLAAALALGAMLLVPTVGMSTLLPATDKLWMGSSYLAAGAFACQLPVFLILDSGPCNVPGATCALGRGSVPAFLSLGAYAILAVGAQWSDCPEWREEYALWKLMRRKRSGDDERGQMMERGATEEEGCGLDEERGYVQGNANGGYVDRKEKGRGALDDLQTSEGRRTVTALPENATQRALETMDLLSHDDLIPGTNDTPLVLQGDAPGMDDATRAERKHAVARLLREERAGKGKNAPSRKARGRRERVGSEGPPVRYVSIRDEDAGREGASPGQSMLVGSAETTEGAEGAPRLTPGRKMSMPESASPMLHGSGSESGTAEECAEATEGRGGGTPVGATPDRGPTSEAAAVSPMTACTGLRFVASGGAVDGTSEVKSGAREVVAADAVAEMAAMKVDAASSAAESVATHGREAVTSVFGNDPFTDGDAEDEGETDRAGLLAHDGLDAGAGGIYAYDIGDVREPPPAAENDARRPASWDSTPAREIDAPTSASGASSTDPRSNASTGRGGRGRAASAFRRKSGRDVPVAADDDGKDGGSAASARPRGGRASFSRSAKKGGTRKKRAGRAAERTSAEGPAPPRMVTPEKDADPALAFYQSESSLSTDDYRSSDDDYCAKSQRAPPPAPVASAPSSGNGSDRSASDDSELSQVIAGVNEQLNRMTSGKITPLHKRRRRKRGGRSVSDDSEQSPGGYSSHGSLLDEVIVEEGELNASHEREREGPASSASRTRRSSIPAIVDASPSPRKKRKDRSGGRGGRSGDGYVRLDEAIPDDECNTGERDSGYESGYASPGAARASDAEESFSSRAARARRNRILAKRRQMHPESTPLAAASTPYAKLADSPTVPDDEPAPLLRPDNGGGSLDRGMNGRPPPTAKLHDRGDGGGDTAAWRARKVRMARLQRMHGGPAAAVAATGADGAFERGGAEFAPDEVVIRAIDGIVLACSSDEDSI